MKLYILTLDFSLKGGIERVISLLANYFNSMGYEVIIVSAFKQNTQASYHTDKNVEVKYLSEYGFFAGSIFKRISNYLRLFLHLKEYAKNADGIFLSTLTNISCMLGVLSIFYKKLNFIAAEHSQYYAHNRIVRFIRKLTYLKASAIVTLTTNDNEIFQRFISREKVLTIRNPVSFNADNTASLDHKRLVTLGRLSPVKGYVWLINELVPFFSKNPEWILDIYGDGDLKEQLSDEIKKLSLQDNVFLKGFSLDISLGLKNSSIYLCSSETEAFPMSFLEAFSSGLPVVSNDCPVGPKEIISDGENGYLIGKGNEYVSIESAVVALINDEHLYNKLVDNAYDSVNKYSIDVTCSSWIQLFKKMEKNNVN
jgi:glycosyltransferase involved in cell wall biosynthesis